MKTSIKYNYGSATLDRKRIYANPSSYPVRKSYPNPKPNPNPKAQ